VTDFLLRQAQASRAGAQGDSLIGCMTSRSEALSKFQVPKSARLLSATQLPLYALISRARMEPVVPCGRPS
jgi:hypothetical protein